MPIEIRQFKCQHCGKMFDNIVNAEKHESSHPKVKHTVNNYNIDKKYPSTIHVEFDDNTILIYYPSEIDTFANEKIK